jgi:hypothetical protein
MNQPFRSAPQAMPPLTESELTHPLCDKHLAGWNAWTDNYPFVLPLRINSGASGDDTVKGVVARKKRAIEDWKETIRFQQALIRRICASQCGVDLGNLS